MSQLDLIFLGNPEVHHGGQAVKFATRKALALLVYLAAAGGRHSRETLTALFWPESDAKQGRAALRNTLAYLRDALGDRPAPHLLIEREALGFDFMSDTNLDLHQVTAAVHAIRAGSKQAPLLATAVSAYRGDFLTGFSLSDAPEFDQWASLQREYWHQQINLVCERLSEWQTTAGDVTPAIDTLTRWLAISPFNELAYQRLIKARLATGDREAALRAYEACRAMLASEFGVEPAPETAALAVALTHVTPLPSSRGAPRAPAGRPQYLEMPLIGRASEYVKLVEIYHMVGQGRTHLVSLEGEAGIGKTHLATEFLAWVAANGGSVIRGRAFETSGRLPYQPVVEALRSWLSRGVGSGERRAESGGKRVESSPVSDHPGDSSPIAALPPVWLVELSRLLPEVRERYPNLAVPAGDDTAARTLLFEAVARLGVALAGQAPLVLFIDDLQWADAASLDLLHYVVRRWAESQTRILLLFTVRTEALTGKSELPGWLATLGRDYPLTRLSLKLLTAEDARQLAQLLTAQETEATTRDQFARWLFQETGGQPFFVTETIKSLLERDLLSLYPDEDGRFLLHIPPALLTQPSIRDFLPPTVRDIIRLRLRQLDPPAATMMAAAAVLGQNFTFDLLRRVAELSESEALPALDELLARRLLQQVDAPDKLPVDPPYIFSHDKIRDVAYTEAGDARRRIFHRRALASLTSEGVNGSPLSLAPVPPAQLAHHALAAGQIEAAFRYSLAAGDEAMRLFAVRDAIAHYEKAQELGSLGSGERAGGSGGEEGVGRHSLRSDVEQRHHLYLQLGRAYELTSQMDQACTIYEAMLALAREAEEAEMTCVALNRLATLTAQHTFDLAASQALLQEALAVAQRSGDKVGLAETEWNLAQMGVYSWQPQVTLTHGQQALALARELGLKELMARSLNVLALGCSDVGQWRRMEQHAREAATLYADLGNRAMEADCLGLVTNALVNYGRAQAGIQVGRRALDIVRDIENPWGQVTATLHLTLGLIDTGHYGEAWRLAQAAASLADAYNLVALRPYILARLGAVQRTMLDFEAAVATHLAALAADELMPPRPFAEMIHGELCADYALMGEWLLAYDQARQALNRRDYASFYLGLTRWYETEALLRGDDAEAARSDAARFGQLLEDKDHGDNNPRFRLPYLRALAVLAWWEGETAQAITYLAEAAALAQDMNLPGEQWPILVSLAQMYQVVGDEEGTKMALRQAGEIVRSLADRIEDETLRTKFLTATPFQRLFDATEEAPG